MARTTNMTAILRLSDLIEVDARPTSSRAASGDAGGGHARAEVEHRLGVDLRDAALADAEDTADLGQASGPRRSTATGRASPGRAACRSPSRIRSRTSRSSTTADGTIGTSPLSARGSAPRSRARSSGPIVVEAIDDSHCRSWSREIRRWSASSASVGDRPVRASSSAIARSTSLRPCPHRPRHPVELAQPVVDRPADPRRGERLELHAALRIEALDGVDQPEHPGADQVARVDARRQPGADTTGDELDERRVRDDQVVAGRRAAPLEPAVPLHGQIGIDVDDAHVMSWPGDQPPSCSRMGVDVRGPQTFAADMGVTLRGADTA